VNYSRGYKWLIGLLIVLTIGWKATITPDLPDDVDQMMISFLSKNGFNETQNYRTSNRDGLIQATTKSCRLLLAKLAHDGSNKDVILAQFAEADRIFVVFQGNVYQDQPTAMTVASYVTSRFLRELGFKRHITPVFAVGENSSCDAEHLPWRDLPW